MSPVKPEHIVILSHEHTDFDALAAMLGAALLFPGAVPILPRQLNRNVRDFVTLYKNQLPFLAPEDAPRSNIKQVILVDTRSASQPKGVKKNATYRIIDHHPGAQSDSGDKPEHEIWIEPVGATTTLLVERLIEQQIRPTSLQATLLALGIHEDTGSLTYASTTARDARALTWLMECAANLAEINHFLHHPLNDTQRQLLEQLLAQSETIEIAGNSIVIAQATAHGFQDEISALAGRLRDFFESDALFLLIDLGNVVQLVARSTTDAIDVGEIARTLGLGQDSGKASGGGHRRAAAAPLHNTTLQSVRQQLLLALEQQSRTGTTVGHIMSLGRPQMLPPDMRIDEAVTLMRRYGHEGFPIVDTDAEGQEHLLGVLTRREADRAWNHGLHKEAVRRFMRAGSLTVKPDDPISLLRSLMVEHDWGQIPVVNEHGQIIGIVTRTDLIKLWDESTLPERTAADMAERMQAALTPTHHHILQLIGKEVAKRGQAVYVVGGFVRDLLLMPEHDSSQSTVSQHEMSAEFDLDIVIEGDAIDFAQQMQQTFGGRVVTHRQFGTAKWILNDVDSPIDHPRLLAALAQVEDGNLLPPNLDFVSARTEFYTAPTALPTVESSSIKLDLHRRDFTINTLALCLSPNRWGVLLDFYGGVSDLKKGIVRILHSLSFIDDPTRILRAVRYEQRFGFRIEARTLELLGDALELLDRVTAARIRHEFQRIFQETLPERTLVRLEQLGVLKQLDLDLASDGWLSTCFERLRAVLASELVAPDWIVHHLTAEPRFRLYWALITIHLSLDTLAVLEQRMQWDKATQRMALDLNRIEDAVTQLRLPTTSPSQITEILQKSDLQTVALFYVAHSDEPLVCTQIEHFYDTWRHVRPAISGEELAGMGIQQGPIFGQILKQLRSLRLDGQIQTRSEETDWINAQTDTKNLTKNNKL